MATSIDPSKFIYEQKLQEIREKCLPLLEKHVEKFTEYKNICTILREKRPSIEWLNRLEATCEKIQKKISAQSLEKTEDHKSSRKSLTTEKSNIEEVSDGNRVDSERRISKQRRWDVKPINDKAVLKSSENRHSSENAWRPTDTSRQESKEKRAKDSDVEIIASTAGYHPLRRARSQSKFATLEEVNKNPFYKKFASDNMILDSRAANLKHGTLFDLVKSRESNQTRNKNRSSKTEKDLSKGSIEKNYSRSDKEKYENKSHYKESTDRKASLIHNESQLTNLVNDTTYEHLQTAVKYLNRKEELSGSGSSKRSDYNSLKSKYGRSGNDFQGKMPFYKQNIPRNPRNSCPEKPAISRYSRDNEPPHPPDVYQASSQPLLSNHNLTNSQYNRVGFPQQRCSFHCDHCKNIPHISSMGVSYPPTTSCVIGNSNYTFFSGQYIPNQPVPSPQHSNLPTPFPTYAIPSLSTTALTSSILPYPNINKASCSVPLFCNERSTFSNKTDLLSSSWNPENVKKNITYGSNIVENTERTNVPRKDTINDNFTQSKANIKENTKSIDPALASKNPLFSRIPEKRFSQSCTFLRPDNLYKDFKCNTDDYMNNSYGSLKSFGLINNITKVELSNETVTANKSNVQHFKKLPNCANHPQGEGNRFNGTPDNLKSLDQTNKQEEKQMIQDKKSHDNYISPLSNLYSELNPKFEGCTNVMNKKMENRKRRYNENPLISNIEPKRKNIGTVKPMTKFLCDKSDECLSPKIKQQPSDSYAIKVQKRSEFNKVQNSLQSNVTNLIAENCKESKYLTCDAKKECQTLSNETSLMNKKSKLNNFSSLEALNSQNVISHGENLFPKENSFEKRYSANTTPKSPSTKKLKNESSKANESLLLIQSKKSEDAQTDDKRKLNKKDKPLQNSKPYNKDSQIVQTQTCEKISVQGMKKEDCNVKCNDLINSSKNIDKKSQSNINSSVKQVVSSGKTKSSEKGKSDHKESSTEKGRMNKNSAVLKSDKKKGTNSICTHKKDQTTTKGNDLVSSRIKDDKKSVSQREKKNDKAKCCIKSNSLKDLNCTSDNNTAITPNPQSKKSIQEHSTNVSLPKKIIIETNINAEGKDVSQEIKLNAQFKSLGMSSSSKKINFDEIKNCIVVLQRENSRKKEEADENVTSVTFLPISCGENKTKSKENQSKKRDKNKKMKFYSDEKTNDETKIIDEIAIPHDGKLLNKEKKNSEELNDGNDKVKDLISRMKSLSQSEALKVISEVASTLKVDQSQNIHFTKDQDVPSKEEMERTISQIKVENDFIEDFPKLLETDNHPANSEHKKFRSCNKSVTVGSRSKSVENDFIEDFPELLETDNHPANSEHKKFRSCNKSVTVGSRSKSIENDFIEDFPKLLENNHPANSEPKKFRSCKNSVTVGSRCKSVENEFIEEFPKLLETDNHPPNSEHKKFRSFNKSVTVGSRSKPVDVGDVNKNTLSSVKAKLLKQLDMKQNSLAESLTAALTAETDVNVKHPGSTHIFEAKSSNENHRTSLPLNNAEPCRNLSSSAINDENTGKRRLNKKKKLSELEKIHADLESCHSLDDIMKCTGLRSCRLKNESGNLFRENTTDEKQNKRRKIIEEPEEPYFIEDEITIKMEPIPELTFDFIKEEPEY